MRQAEAVLHPWSALILDVRAPLVNVCLSSDDYQEASQVHQQPASASTALCPYQLWADVLAAGVQHLAKLVAAEEGVLGLPSIELVRLHNTLADLYEKRAARAKPGAPVAAAAICYHGSNRVCAV